MSALDDIEYSKNHFIQRLKERYGIDITDKEYFELVNSNACNAGTLAYKLKWSAGLFIIQIKGVHVLVVRRSAGRKLIEYPVFEPLPAALTTCLPLDGPFPVPKKLGVLGVKREQFNEELNNIIRDAVIAANDLIIMGQREFFINHTASPCVKRCAKRWATKGYMEPDVIVRECVARIIAIIAANN